MAPSKSTRRRSTGRKSVALTPDGKSVARVAAAKARRRDSRGRFLPNNGAASARSSRRSVSRRSRRSDSASSRSSTASERRFSDDKLMAAKVPARKPMAAPKARPSRRRSATPSRPAAARRSSARRRVHYDE